MKWIVLLVLVAGCGVSNKAVETEQIVLKTFQVRCPLTTIESTTDTVKADAYDYYGNSGLRFYKGSSVISFKQFPATCVVKELSE